MGNPLSKCCAEDTTVPRKKITITRTTKTSNGVKTTTTASSSTGASSTAASESEPVASYVPPKDDASTKDNASLFQRISGSLASITDTIGGSPSRSIEQGLKDFSYSLTEEERKVLLANEIPASEIKKLSIGVDAGGMGIIHVAEYKGIKVAIKEASVHVISKEVRFHPMDNPVWPGLARFLHLVFPLPCHAVMLHALSIGQKHPIQRSFSFSFFIEEKMQCTPSPLSFFTANLPYLLSLNGAWPPTLYFSLFVSSMVDANENSIQGQTKKFEKKTYITPIQTSIYIEQCAREMSIFVWGRCFSQVSSSDLPNPIYHVCVCLSRSVSTAA